jgi:hypothetical protein
MTKWGGVVGPIQIFALGRKTYIYERDGVALIKPANNGLPKEGQLTKTLELAFEGSQWHREMPVLNFYCT